ncbi:MAG: hypothetical protein OEO20_11390 [Gemmatimonadota bacterium]|nr:hypothetical protein [Gemmatimonadota bacterium]
MTLTRANHKALRRVVSCGRLGELVVELRAGTLTVRPLRARTPLFEATYSEIVTAVLLNREPRRKTRRRR